MFFLVFLVSKEIANYTTIKETNNRFLRIICFSRAPVPLVTVVLIIIDYICLAAIIAFNCVSLFLSDNCAFILMLVCNGVFLSFSFIVGTISYSTKKKYWESIG